MFILFHSLSSKSIFADYTDLLTKRRTFSPNILITHIFLLWMVESKLQENLILEKMHFLYQQQLFGKLVYSILKEFNNSNHTGQYQIQITLTSTFWWFTRTNFHVMNWRNHHLIYRIGAFSHPICTVFTFV